MIRTLTTTTILLALISFAAVSTQAQTAPIAPPTAPVATAPAIAPVPTPTAPSWSTTITPSLVSEYVFRGTRLGGWAFQPSISTSYGPWNAEIWASDPLANSDKVTGQSDPEIDLSASYTWTISDSLNVQPGATLYTYPRAPLNEGFYRTTFEPNLGVNWTVLEVTLTPKVYYDVVLRGPTYELNSAYTLPLKEIGTELDWAASAGTYLLDDSINGSKASVKTWGDYWSAGVSAPFAITSQSKLSVGWAYSRGTGSYSKEGVTPKQANQAQTDQGVTTVSWAWTF